jgi:hypothetical protein
MVKASSLAQTETVWVAKMSARIDPCRVGFMGTPAVVEAVSYSQWLAWNG